MMKKVLLYMTVLHSFQYKECLCILTFPQCNEKLKIKFAKFTDQIKKNSKRQLVVANGVSVNDKNKNTLKYDYFPDFVLCMKNAFITNH